MPVLNTWIIPYKEFKGFVKIFNQEASEDNPGMPLNFDLPAITDFTKAIAIIKGEFGTPSNTVHSVIFPVINQAIKPISNILVVLIPIKITNDKTGEAAMWFFKIMSKVMWPGNVIMVNAGKKNRAIHALTASEAKKLKPKPADYEPKPNDEYIDYVQQIWRKPFPKDTDGAIIEVDGYHVQLQTATNPPRPKKGKRKPAPATPKKKGEGKKAGKSEGKGKKGEKKSKQEKETKKRLEVAEMEGESEVAPLVEELEKGEPPKEPEKPKESKKGKGRVEFLKGIVEQGARRSRPRMQE